MTYILLIILTLSGPNQDSKEIELNHKNIKIILFIN